MSILRVSFLALLAFLAVPLGVGAVEPIEEAFGLKIGGEFVPAEGPDAFTTLNGIRAYYFAPESPSPFFTLYLVQITPITQLVHTVIAIGPGPDLPTCLRHRADLMPALTERYGKSFNFEPPAGPAYEKDYEIILQADQKRGVGVTCGGNADVILQIIYVDDVLSDLAELERLQLTSEETDKMVL